MTHKQIYNKNLIMFKKKKNAFKDVLTISHFIIII